MVDLEVATRFLKLLEPEGQFTFQTFPDATGGTALAVVRHGAFDVHAEELRHLNDRGAGVFVMVNAGDGTIHPGSRTCRTAANVLRVRALFVDLDGAPVEPVLRAAAPPDWVVGSSHGRWHAYWRVDDCPLNLFPCAQLALAVKFSGDRTVRDLPRVLRIPGFVHRKATPFLSKLFTPPAYESLLEATNEQQ